MSGHSVPTDITPKVRLMGDALAKQFAANGKRQGRPIDAQARRDSTPSSEGLAEIESAFHNTRYMGG
jgi:hypothetical protein